MQELIGTTINHYQIERHLTRGGMSEIYLALDTQTQTTVAIKLVHSSNIDYCKRFKHEVKTVSSLQHDHILPAFSYGDYKDWCYMVTPYVEYGTLNRKLADGPLSFEEAGNILEQLSSALQYAHDQGVVHRDIKPTNILLQDGEHVYLADFGLVKRVGDNNGFTVTGYLIGTPEYMAPELAEEPASAKSDQYALGILLYQMLTGHVPFTAKTPLGVYLKQVGERPIEPATLNPAIPDSINDVILRALQKEPRHRYNTVYDFAQAYKKAYDAIQTPLLVHNQQIAEAQVYQANTQEIQRRRKRNLSHPLLIAVMLIFCFIPLTLGFLISSHSNSTQHPPAQTLLLSGEQNKLIGAVRSTQPTPSTKNTTTHTQVHPTPSKTPTHSNQQYSTNQQDSNNDTSENDNNNTGNKHGKGHGHGHNK